MKPEPPPKPFVFWSGGKYRPDKVVKLTNRECWWLIGLAVGGAVLLMVTFGLAGVAAGRMLERQAQAEVSP